MRLFGNSGNPDLVKHAGIQLFGVQQVNRLQNGNTVICQLGAPGELGLHQKKDWHSRRCRSSEVTPEKKVVWALREWNNPDLGTASGKSKCSMNGGQG